MSWEQDISQLLTSLEESALRFDIHQDLTNTQKNTAKTNIGFGGASAAQTTGDDYKITFQ